MLQLVSTPSTSPHQQHAPKRKTNKLHLNSAYTSKKIPQTLSKNNYINKWETNTVYNIPLSQMETSTPPISQQPHNLQTATCDSNNSKKTKKDQPNKQTKRNGTKPPLKQPINTNTTKKQKNKTKTKTTPVKIHHQPKPTGFSPSKPPQTPKPNCLTSSSLRSSRVLVNFSRKSWSLVEQEALHCKSGNVLEVFETG